MSYGEHKTAARKTSTEDLQTCLECGFRGTGATCKTCGTHRVAARTFPVSPAADMTFHVANGGAL